MTEKYIIKSTSSFDDYAKVDAGEPFKAHIVSWSRGTKNFKGEEQEKLFVQFELDEGAGKGQKYKGDFNPVLTSAPKQSNLSAFVEKVYGEVRTELDPDDLLGRPIRVLLSEPWGDKGLQFAKSYLKPTADQKRVEVAPVAQEDTSDPSDPVAQAAKVFRDVEVKG